MPSRRLQALVAQGILSRVRNTPLKRTAPPTPRRTTTQNRISLLIKARKRETGLGVREAAKASSISAATFSRLERGALATLPDVGTLEKLAKWLGVTLKDLLGEQAPAGNPSVPEPSTPELVEVHLRADKNLTPQTARALADMFKALYVQFTKTDNT
jgi:transcriptional regulator with XRE-family HTH domain